MRVICLKKTRENNHKGEVTFNVMINLGLMTVVVVGLDFFTDVHTWKDQIGWFLTSCSDVGRET